MNGAASMTAGEFLECRYELPEAGQWSELEAGELVHLQPPDLDHGTVILNLSKAFAEHAQGTRQGYACFDLGLQLTSAPDTVRFPAACYFDAGPRFAESDRQITSTVPALVVELASTADRLRLQPERSHAFLDWGVRAVWTILPRQRIVNIYLPGQPGHTATAADRITGDPVLDQFCIDVSALFAEPAWWTGQPGPRR